MKHIDISKTCKKNGVPFAWVYTIPAKSICVHNVNGIRVASTERNYYYSNQDQKIHYQTMDCSNASYDHLYDLYAEVYPGIFAHMAITSECEISIKLDMISNHVKALSSNDVEIWRKGLERIGK